MAAVNFTEVSAKAIAARAAIELNPNQLGGPATYEMLAYLATAIEQFSSSSGNANPGSGGSTKLNRIGAASLNSGNNLLNLTAGSDALDLASLPVSYNSLTFQLVSAVSLSSGLVLFEGSNDNVNFLPIQAVEEQFSWSNLTWTQARYPIGIATATGRTFTIPLRFRYIRVRVALSLSTPIICHQSFSTATFDLPTGTFPLANQILKTTFNNVSATNNQMVAAPGNNLSIYFCGMVIADGNSGGTVADWWICDGNGPNGAKLGVFSRRTTDPESGNIYVNNPVPLTVNTLLDLYNNGSATNAWVTANYFVAPAP